MKSDTALLWCESHLWGIMTYDALRRLGLGFTLVSSSDVREGRLSKYKAVLVPGGWASNKMRALGEDGTRAIRDFVSSGGTYIGLCGGAGLATLDGVGLIKVRRKPLAQRVPSVSGRVRLSVSSHPIWEGVNEPLFDIWWPSQFVVEDKSLKVLASFAEATPESFSSDFCVGDMDSRKWEEAERSYGINLDPSKMAGDPMVVEGAFGKGRVLTSLVHFDTPGSRNGEKSLNNILGYLGLNEHPYPLRSACGPGGKLYDKAEEIFSYGERNFLWFRNGPLLQWRRGVRGLEYFTLYRIAEEITCRINEEGAGVDGLGELEEAMETFTDKAIGLLALERSALQRGERITFAETQDSEIRALREELFSTSKSYGGAFKELLDGMDGLLFRLLSGEMEKDREASGRKTGLLHIYTGDGKGKTTASAGLALRAASRGLRVLFAQFLKDREGGEPAALGAHGVDVVRFKKVLSPLFHDVDEDEVRREAVLALKELAAKLGDYDLVVLDEFVTLVSKGFVTEGEVLEFIDKKPAAVELVITGRGASARLINVADLVTQMNPVRHPYKSGVEARSGIEY